MPRQAKPENQIKDRLAPHIQSVRDELGLSGRSYRKTDGNVTSRIGYRVTPKGSLPHYASDDDKQAAADGGKVVFSDPWKAIWLAAGTSEPSTIEVGILREEAKTDGDGKPTGEVNQSFKAAGSEKIGSAKEVFGEGDGVLDANGAYAG
jgi:hypothetical protein